MIENSILVERIIRTALEEDLGAGDLTTDLTVDPGTRGSAFVQAREKLVLAGIGIFTGVFSILSSEMAYEYYFQDGQTVPAGENICSLSGPVSVILKGERTALNFLQRMSGIATLTRSYVDKVAGRQVRIVDTRKTAPGLRVLDKYAVRMGGGLNHRGGLYDGILIKDNHIVAAGSINRAVTLAKAGAPHTVRVQVEVEDLEGLKEAIESGADAVLLDNMTPDMMKKAVSIANGKVLLEASGGININNVEEVSRTGVDIISVGALTHSPKAMDIGLDMNPF